MTTPAFTPDVYERLRRIAAEEEPDVSDDELAAATLASGTVSAPRLALLLRERRSVGRETLGKLMLRRGLLTASQHLELLILAVAARSPAPRPSMDS